MEYFSRIGVFLTPFWRCIKKINLYDVEMMVDNTYRLLKIREWRKYEDKVSDIRFG